MFCLKVVDKELFLVGERGLELVASEIWWYGSNICLLSNDNLMVTHRRHVYLSPSFRLLGRMIRLAIAVLQRHALSTR